MQIIKVKKSSPNSTMMLNPDKFERTGNVMLIVFHWHSTRNGILRRIHRSRPSAQSQSVDAAARWTSALRRLLGLCSNFKGLDFFTATATPVIGIDIMKVEWWFVYFPLQPGFACLSLKRLWFIRIWKNVSTVISDCRFNISWKSSWKCNTD